MDRQWLMFKTPSIVNQVKLQCDLINLSTMFSNFVCICRPVGPTNTIKYAKNQVVDLLYPRSLNMHKIDIGASVQDLVQ